MYELQIRIHYGYYHYMIYKYEFIMDPRCTLVLYYINAIIYILRSTQCYYIDYSNNDDTSNDDNHHNSNDKTTSNNQAYYII